MIVCDDCKKCAACGHAAHVVYDGTLYRARCGLCGWSSSGYPDKDTPKSEWDRIMGGPQRIADLEAELVSLTAKLAETKVLAEEAANAQLREALTTLPYTEYADALRDGCDPAGAWDCFCTALREHVESALGVRTFRDGNQWCAVRSDFISLQESPAGFGDTRAEALATLEKETP